MKYWLVWFLVWVMVATPLTPYAQRRSKTPAVEQPSATPILLEDAIRLYEELEWEASVEKFKTALDTGLNVEDSAQAYWYLMLLAHAFGDRQESEGYLFEAFRLKPDLHALQPLRDPVLEEIFNGVWARVDRTPPKVSILPLAEADANQPILVIAEILDDSSLVEVKLIYQLRDAEEPSAVKMQAEKATRWSAEIPASATTTLGEFEFQVFVQDDWKNTTSENGKFVVSRGSSESRILYLVGGAVVAFGGGIVALLLGQSGDDDSSSMETWPQSKPPRHPQLTHE